MGPGRRRTPVPQTQGLGGIATDVRHPCSRSPTGANRPMNQQIFQPALEEMGDDRIFGPMRFCEYTRARGLGVITKTAEFVSVDHREKLRAELVASETMVLRLGRGSFCLARSQYGLDDFFLDHETIFGNTVTSSFLPDVSWRSLFAFEVLPALSESSLVNLGMASGAFGHALGLDPGESVHVPATGQSTFSFEFAPFERAQSLRHDKGQVEIDGLFVAHRNGKPTLFVIEGKSTSYASIAKHKLVYPVLALASAVPSSLEIVPVYVHAYRQKDGVHFRIAECHYPDPRSCTMPALTALQARCARHLVLPLHVVRSL